MTWSNLAKYSVTQTVVRLSATAKFLVLQVYMGQSFDHSLKLFETDTKTIRYDTIILRKLTGIARLVCTRN